MQRPRVRISPAPQSELDSAIEELGIRELLEVLLDDRAKRRLSHRGKTNDELFRLYYDHLKVRLTPGQYEQYKDLLDKFHQFLGQFSPSVELPTQFLAQYSNRAPATLARYAGMVRGFMEWYGESLDIKTPRAKPLPQYVESGDVDRLIDVISKKRSHKRTVARDILLVKFDRMTGLRCGELANLTAGDIQTKNKVVVVRKGKGRKDRAVPLHTSLIDETADFIKDMKPTDSVFGLKARSITDKICTWSKKAGVKLHTHSLRHHFAEQLLDAGAQVTVVQQLLGHDNLQTTAGYLGLRPGAMQEAVDSIGTPNVKKEKNSKKSSGLDPILPDNKGQTEALRSFDKQEDVLEVIKELEEFSANLGGTQFNAILVIQKLWGKFELGMSRNDVVEALTKCFPSENPGIEYFEFADSLLGELSLHQIIRPELHRMSGVRTQWDTTFWVLTNAGKKVIRYLRVGDIP